MNRNGSGKDVIEPEDDVAIQVKEWSHPFPDTGLDITLSGTTDGRVSGQTNGMPVCGSASRTEIGKLPFCH